MRVCLKAKVEAKAWFMRRRWFLSHPHQKGMWRHDLPAGKSCSRWCWQTNCFLMLKQPGAGGKWFLLWSWGKKGIETEGKSVSLSSFPPERTGGLMPSEEGIHKGMVEDQCLEQLSWDISWFTFLWLPVPRIPDVNWNQKISQSATSEPSHGWVTSCLTWHCTNDPEKTAWCDSSTVI